MDICSKTGVYRELAKNKRPFDYLELQNDLLLTADIVAGIATGYLSIIIYFGLVHAGPWPVPLDGPLWREIILGGLIAALVVREPQFADRRQLLNPGCIATAVAQRCALALAILLSVGLATRALHDVARLWVFGWAISWAAWVAISRWALLGYTERRCARGEFRESVAVLGAPELAERLAANLSIEAEIVTVIDDLDDPQDGSLCPALAELQELAGLGLIDTVVLALAPGDAIDAASLVDQLKGIPVQITICTDLSATTPLTWSYRMLGGVPLAVVSDRPLARWSLFLKNAMDKALSLFLLIVLLPMLLGVALAIMAESPGPVIFRQKRRGWGGRVFTIYKFRTMFHASAEHALRQTARQDARCTRVGIFLRNMSLDELPQLWNVLRGDMSLVGPRPHPEAMHGIEQAGCQVVSEYAQRQRVKPGMTGWAQIHGSRGAVETPDQMRRRVQLDLYYIDHWSILLDLRILACTPLCVLRAENAY